jgi:hypothetical protein
MANEACVAACLSSWEAANLRFGPQTDPAATIALWTEKMEPFTNDELTAAAKDYSDRATDFPTPFEIRSIILANRRDRAQRQAALPAPQADGERWITGEEFNRRMGEIARKLRNVGKGAKPREEGDE